MRPSEAAVLLAAAAAVDNRIVTESTVREWADALAGYTLEECLAALRKFRRETVGVYLEPGHIRQRVRAARDEAWARGAAQRALPAAPPASAEARAAAHAMVREALARRRAGKAESKTASPDNRQNREAPE